MNMENDKKYREGEDSYITPFTMKNNFQNER